MWFLRLVPLSLGGLHVLCRVPLTRNKLTKQSAGKYLLSYLQGNRFHCYGAWCPLPGTGEPALVVVDATVLITQSGISAAGGLAMTSANDNHEDSYSQGLIIGFRMVQVAIGITVSDAAHQLGKRG